MSGAASATGAVAGATAAALGVLPAAAFTSTMTLGVLHSMSFGVCAGASTRTNDSSPSSFSSTEAEAREVDRDEDGCTSSATARGSEEAAGVAAGLEDQKRERTDDMKRKREEWAKEEVWLVERRKWRKERELRCGAGPGP